MKFFSRIIVIGGGIVGVSTLYHLARAGEKEILLLERLSLTSGATWHAAGNVHTQSAYANLSALQAYSLRLYDGLEAEIGQKVGSHIVGGFFLAQTKKRMEEFKYLAGKFRSIGLEYDLVSPSEIKSKFPLLNVTDLEGGAWDPEEGYVDPYSVTMGLATAAKKNGAKIIENTQIDAISRLPSGHWELTSGDHIFECEIIVNCAGFWAREVAEMINTSVPITNMEHHYLVTENIPTVEVLHNELPVIRDTDSHFYLRQESNGLLFGSWEKDCRAAWNGKSAPWSFGQELFNNDLARLEENLAMIFHRLPELHSTGIKQITNGAISFSPDGRPIVGPMPGVPGFFVACGFVGGIAQAGGAGLAMSQWILNGETELNLDFMDVARFGDWTTKEFARERTYEIFPKRYEIIYPAMEHQSGRSLKLTPINNDLIKLGAIMGQSNGWERPLWYAPDGVEAQDEPSFQRPNWWEHVGNEAKGMASGCGLTEMSTYGKFLITGSDALEFLNYVGSAKAPERPGKIALSLLLNDRGGIVGDIIIDCRNGNEFYLVGATLGVLFYQRWLEAHTGGFNVKIKNATSHYAAIGISGPNSRALLNSLSNNCFDEFPYMTSKDLEINGIACRALRVSFSGELGWELHCPISNQKALFDALMNCSKNYGLVLIGSRAMGMLRLEKGYRSLGAELTTEITPHAAGLQRFCSSKKNYIGRKKIDSEKKTPPKKRFVTLDVDLLAPPCWGDEPIFSNGELIGYVTSGGMGWRCNKMLAVGWIDASKIGIGDMLEVQILLKSYNAKVVSDPIYDPENQLLLN